MAGYTRTIFIGATLLLAAVGCAQDEVIPERLEGRVNRDLRYVEVKDNPEKYRGQLMLAGGKVLSATRLKDGTRIEVLQRPLSSELVPEDDKESHGRFVAMDVDGQLLDPAVLEDNKLITVVGEVQGSATIQIDQVKDDVPKLRVKHVTVWDERELRPYYGYRYPYTYGYGPYYGRALYW